MPQEIRVDEDRGIIHVQDYGNVSKEEVVKTVTEARHIFTTKGIHKILVDSTKLEAMPNKLDIYDVFATLPREFKMAILVQESQETERDLSFGVAVANSRTIAARIFYEKERALAWLASR